MNLKEEIAILTKEQFAGELAITLNDKAWEEVQNWLKAQRDQDLKLIRERVEKIRNPWGGCLEYYDGFESCRQAILKMLEE